MNKRYAAEILAAVFAGIAVFSGCAAEPNGNSQAEMSLLDGNNISKAEAESTASETASGVSDESTAGVSDETAAVGAAAQEITDVRVVSTELGEKPVGDTGKPFVNDYNPADRSYAASDNYISPKEDRQYGTTTTVSYYSSTLGTMRNADVILPYGYNSAVSYPVLYMLHGMGGSNKSWSDMGVKYIVQNVHYENNVPDMIVVCVDCFVSTAVQSEVSIYEMVSAYDKVEDEMINDLMPYINAHYSTKTGRNNTAIAGYSLGGRGALAIGFKHQDSFGYIGAFSAASGVIPNPSGRSGLTTQIQDFVLKHGDFPMLLINLGETDGICGNSCRFYDEALTARNIKHIFYEMEGDHEGSVWQNGLYNFVKRIF